MPQGTPRRVTRAWLLDMDGVLAHEERVIPGADRFVSRLRELDVPFLVLTRGVDQPGHPRGPYFIGKPNPLMMRSALNALGVHSETTTMIGDRMDTDVVAGLEAGLETILVLSGVTARHDAERFPYRASRMVESVADLIDELGA